MKCIQILILCVCLHMVFGDVNVFEFKFPFTDWFQPMNPIGYPTSTGKSRSSSAGTSIRNGRPCKSRQMPGQSVVCVCNATYCDELVRVIPAQGKYVTYTSSEAGSRFVRAIRNLQDKSYYESNVVELVLNPRIKYQKVEGFGGAVTDSAAINWLNLTDPRLKKAFIDTYFSKLGLEYNMLRVPIGGSDFSTHPYAYNESPSDDLLLSNFSLAFEDYQYKIPMIKEIMKTAVAPVHIVSGTWSPPLWMKNKPVWGGKNKLKPEYYQVYADYHIKFLEAYESNGIPIWGITTTNEPADGFLGFATINCVGWSPWDQAKWIVENFGPTLRNSSFSDIKILALDDQRASIPWILEMLYVIPKMVEYIDGVALHYYSDIVIPPEFLSFMTDKYPDKILLSTEACEGFIGSPRVLLGSWERAKGYITDIMEDLNYNVVGWIDWNLCLNEQGGPNWVDNFVDSPVIVFPQNKEFVKQPMFYAMGHFSKFLPRGSQRIKVTQKTNLGTTPINNVAFLTPRNTVVVVLYNDGGPRRVTIQLGQKKAVVPMEARSVVTVEMAFVQN